MLPSHLSSGGLRLAHSGQQRTVGDALHALDASLEVGEVFADGHGCAWRRPGEGPHAQPQAGRMRVSKDKNTRCSPGPARLFRAYSHAEIDVLLVVVDGRPRVRGGSQRRLPRSKSAWADARRACEQRRVHSCSGGCNVHVCLATDDARSRSSSGGGSSSSSSIQHTLQRWRAAAGGSAAGEAQAREGRGEA
jgi:hypothetical protein